MPTRVRAISCVRNDLAAVVTAPSFCGARRGRLRSPSPGSARRGRRGGPDVEAVNCEPPAGGTSSRVRRSQRPVVTSASFSGGPAQDTCGGVACGVTAITALLLPPPNTERRTGSRAVRAVHLLLKGEKKRRAVTVVTAHVGTRQLVRRARTRLSRALRPLIWTRAGKIGRQPCVRFPPPPLPVIISMTLDCAVRQMRKSVRNGCAWLEGLTWCQASARQPDQSPDGTA